MIIVTYPIMIAAGIITLRPGSVMLSVAAAGRETRLLLPVGSLATASSFFFYVEQ
jgi:hypothetical protein